MVGSRVLHVRGHLKILWPEKRAQLPKCAHTFAPASVLYRWYSQLGYSGQEAVCDSRVSVALTGTDTLIVLSRDSVYSF